MSELVRAEFDGVEHVAVRVHETGRGVLEVVGLIIADVVAGLRADKNMRWSDPELAYSRPIRWIVALWGDTVVPVSVSGLRSGRTTYGERTEAGPLIEVENADVLLPKLAERDFIVDPAERRKSVVAQAHSLAASVGGVVDIEGEAALVDEITNLVEAPHGILGSFEERYLELPEQILTTVMRKHQRYLPVRTADGALMRHFVTMANGDCDDDLVRVGNENVLRARYEDAAFFYAADLKVPLADLRAGIAKLTFEERVGSMADRADRIRDVAAASPSTSRSTCRRARRCPGRASLAKFDLASQMVVELSSLAGYMAREYALKAGETPRGGRGALRDGAAADRCGRRRRPGALLALADRFDLLMAMFALGAKPTGSSDRTASRGARRHRHPALAADALGDLGRAGPARRGRPAAPAGSRGECRVDRRRRRVRDRPLRPAAARGGRAVHARAAVQPLAGSPGGPRRHCATSEGPWPRWLREARGGHPRITRIVPEGNPAAYDTAVLREDAERALHEKVAAPFDLAGGTLPEWADAATGTVAVLERFFDEVLVMAEEPELRAARLGLLQTVVERPQRDRLARPPPPSPTDRPVGRPRDPGRQGDWAHHRHVEAP